MFAHEDGLGASDSGDIEQDAEVAGDAEPPWMRDSVPVI